MEDTGWYSSTVIIQQTDIQLKAINPEKTNDCSQALPLQVYAAVKENI